MESIAPYQSTHKIRFVTAASLFDGHDATINIMRRILQSTGAEVIHLGHNRSVDEIVNCAIQEDVQGIALTSYQGGHVEYFKYMHDLLAERGAGHIKIFGGGGGVFLPHEIAELQAYGISKIYSPDDGRTMGLQGMINDMMRQCDFLTPGITESLTPALSKGSLTPNPSPRERGLNEVSPIGGDLEGASSENSLTPNLSKGSLTPNPSPRERGLNEVSPVGGDLEGASSENSLSPALSKGSLTPNPSPRERGLNDVSPIGGDLEGASSENSLTPALSKGEGVKKRRMMDKGDIARLVTAAELGSLSLALSEGSLTPSPSPRERGLNEVSPVGGDLEGASLEGAPVLGITGTGGSGKSSLVDEFVRRFLMETDKTLAIISVDPSKRKTGGALLGDRIRMNAINNPRVYMRSLATRQANLALSKHVQEAIDICKAAGYDMVIVETSGIGQSDTMITDYCDVSLYVMTPEFGAATQLEKIDMLDFADLVALNKFDKRGALDALRDVRKQYKRNHMLFDAKDDDLPVYGTMASQFNDPGMNTLFTALMRTVKEKTGVDLLDGKIERQKTKEGESEKIYIIPPDRVRYLAEIAESSAAYTDWVNEQCKIAQQMYQVRGSLTLALSKGEGSKAFQDKALSFGEDLGEALQDIYNHLENHLHPDCKRLLKEWPGTVAKYKADNFIYKVRDREIKQPLYYTSLSQLQIPKIALPKYEAWGDILRWLLTENVPGEFPYAAGVFPLKREGEDPTRMFAGEGGPERTNKRFHYVSLGQPAHRLSTAFDSVTLYGEDPHERPDIYGKIGNSGVSIATLDDAKKLYSGFDLCHPSTSVSMTINGPAPMLLGFFMNTAIDQQCEKYITEHGLQHLVEAAFKRVYDDKGLERPRYQGASPALKEPHPALSKGEGSEKSFTKGSLTGALSEEPYPTLSKGEGSEKSFTKGSLTGALSEEPYPALSKGEGSEKTGVKRMGFETADLRIWELLKGNSKDNRQNPTEAESLLWNLLRNSQIGFKIRRQHAIDGYIADFVCLPKGLVIEVDGGYHDFNKEQDDIRTRALKEEGFDVIRFTNDEVLQNTPGVINAIIDKLNNQPDRKVLSFGEDLGEASIGESLTPALSKGEGAEKEVLSFGEDLGEASTTLPPGNNGLGLMLLGLTGDQVLPADVYEQIRAYAIATVRGTVQADILKEDQAQNTCIFSTEFALRMMGDIQQYFIKEKVRNFYSVSISGYHIAEAGANPITQLAFTLSNGFTYVEYYLSRGMHIDDFAPNLSFFFSNGIDPEYSVIGRVARRIWAKAIKNKYKGNDRSQKLKYHIQTSGRSLHAQEIDFNDIRTTLQALYAIYDNCNSLHTNAYDEAITTPTEESVRRAMAIQLIINRELGLAKNENPIQGAFIIEELTDLVEQAVLTEFKAINDRGGVLGAMETMYQRSKIQEESLYYETLKHTGEYPIIGVNTFLNKKGSPTIVPSEVIRATEEEKQFQIAALHLFKQRNEGHAPALLKELQEKAIAGDNIFEALMQACKYCSLGQISHALYEVGGQYRRNM